MNRWRPFAASVFDDGRPVGGVLELEPEIVVSNFTRVFGEVDDMGDDAGAIASETFGLGGVLRGAVPEREAPQAEEERAGKDEEHPPPSCAALTHTEPDAEPEQPNATKPRQLGTEKPFRSHVSCGGPWHFTQFHRPYSIYILHLQMVVATPARCAEADRKITLARLSSAFYRFNRLSSDNPVVLRRCFSNPRKPDSYATGVPVRELADRFGVHLATVSELVRRAGLPT